MGVKSEKKKNYVPDNFDQQDLIKLLVPVKRMETNLNLEDKIGIISNSQSDQFMRLNAARFFERVSVMPNYINSAYKTIINKNKINICNLLKEVRSNRELQSSNNKRKRKK